MENPGRPPRGGGYSPLHQGLGDTLEGAAITTCRVRFQWQGAGDGPSPALDRTVEVEAGTVIATAARAAGIELGLPCGGQGRCGRCTVIVREGSVHRPPNQRLSAADLEAGYALACQATVQGDVTIEVPVQEIARRLQTDKTAQRVQVPLAYDLRDQPIIKHVVTITPPSLDDQTDDWSRLKRELVRQFDIVDLTAELPVLKRLGPALRAGDWTVTVVIEKDRPDAPQGPPRLVDVLAGDRSESLWGVAIDIGTTTNVVWLVDLFSGEVIAQAADYNGQIARGEDVISRIIYASRGDGLADLQRLVIQTLNRLLGQVADQVRHSTRDRRDELEPTADQPPLQHEIYRVVVAGNSTMIHLLAGLSPEPIRLMPFVTTVNQLPTLRAHELGLDVCPDAGVDCLPGIASYVGADITSGVLSSGMCDGEKLTLFIDVGTNGEIVLGDCTWLISCACSAGPAFEGAGVRYGMRATQGAIEEVWIDLHTYEPTVRVIGPAGEKPRGICGSGLIGLMAEMFTAGIVDKGGNINAGLGTQRTREGPHGGEYVVVWAAEAANGEDIVITDVDLDNLMRAKAAIYAGFAVLTQSVGLSMADVERILIGGAFGQYINIEKAIQIGLLPDAPWDSFAYMGNTSVRGAYLSLLSREARQRVTDLAGMMTYLELSADNSFFDAFNAALFLPHTDESQFPSVAALMETDKGNVELSRTSD